MAPRDSLPQSAHFPFIPKIDSLFLLRSEINPLLSGRLVSHLTPHPLSLLKLGGKVFNPFPVSHAPETLK